MSEVQRAFAALKASVENALQLANPVQALKEAEHAFMEVLAQAHMELIAAHNALAGRVATLESIATSLEPKAAVADVKSEAEGVLHKVEEFVDNLLHPDTAPSSTEPAAPSNNQPSA